MASNSDRAAIGVDWQTVRRTGSTRTAWTAWVQDETREADGHSFDYTLRRVSVNCDAETITSYSMVSYLIGASEPINSKTESYPTASVAVPETIGAGLVESLCGDPPAEGIDTASEFAQLIRDYLFTSGE